MERQESLMGREGIPPARHRRSCRPTRKWWRRFERPAARRCSTGRFCEPIKVLADGQPPAATEAEPPPSKSKVLDGKRLTA